MGKIIFPLIFFFASFLFGLSVWKRVVKLTSLGLVEMIISPIIGWFLLLNAIFFLSFAFRSLQPETVIGLIISITILSFFDNFKKIKWQEITITPKSFFVFSFLAGLSLLIFLLFKNLLFWQDGNLFSGWITIWGDWPAHFAYATSFAYGDNFPPELPLFAGQRFSYPFLADFFSAVLLKFSIDLKYSFVIPGILSVISGTIILSYFYKSISRQWGIALIGTILFLSNGGLGFIYFLDKIPPKTLLTQIPAENIQWASIITTQFAPQRSISFAFPLTVIILFLLYKIYRENPKRNLYLFTGFLLSLLPLAHMHSFLSLLIVSAWVSLLSIKNFKKWIFFALPIIIIAMPVVSYFFFQTTKGFIVFHPGWMAKSLNDWPIFAIKNFGVMLLLPFLGLLVLPRKKSFFFFPFFIIFILANLFLFQPWDWDNTKLFFFWSIGASFLAATFLYHIAKNYKIIGLVLALILFIVATFSGAHDALELLKMDNENQSFSKEQFAVAKVIRENTPPKSIFLTADNHDNLVTSLSGRKSLLIFPGWLWSYGIDFAKRQNDVNIMKSGGGEAKKLLNQYRVNYILLGPAEKYQNFNEDFFSKDFKTIYKSPSYKIIKISD